MPTRRNPAFGGGFNNSGFVEAAQGLSTLFAPPSGADAAGFANAAKAKQETQFLSELFGATQRAAGSGDMTGMDPWVYATGRNFGNTYAGHNQTLASQRKSAMDVAMAAPVAAGATRFVPPGIASMYGVNPMQFGSIELKPGEVTHLADGRVLNGPAVPLTMDQAQARAFQQLPTNVQQQRALAGDGVVAVRDPASGAVIQTSRANAAAQGLTPVDVAGMQAGQNQIDLERAKGVSVGRDGTVVMSPAEAAVRGLPQTIQGVQELRPNTSLVVPNVQDGVVTTQTLQGPEKPETIDQVKAAELAKLRASGVIDDQMMAAILAGNLHLSVVEGPNGPVYAAGPAAIGQRAAAVPTNTQKFGSYIVAGPDGRQTPLPARWDSARNVWVDAQSGAPVPAGVQVTEMARPQGALNEVSAGTAGAIDKQLLNIDTADRMIDAYAKIATAAGTQGLAGRAIGTFQNVIQQGGEIGQLMGIQRKVIDDAVAANAFAPDVLARFSNFRVDIPAADAMRQMLIAQIALATTNDNQVSNRDVERVEAMIGGGGLLSNAADTAARLEALKANLAMRKQALSRAGTPGTRFWQGTNTPVPQPTPQPGLGAAPPAVGQQIPTRVPGVTIQRVQ